MADTAKHTPGPWEVFTNKDDPQMLNFHSAIYGPAGEYDGLFVALSNQNGRYEADAKLIAAAPELLEALKPFAECCNFIDQEIPDSKDTSSWTFQAGDFRRARAAIAKAEGA